MDDFAVKKPEPLCGWEWYNKHKNDEGQSAVLFIKDTKTGKTLQVFKEGVLPCYTSYENDGDIMSELKKVRPNSLSKVIRTWVKERKKE